MSKKKIAKEQNEQWERTFRGVEQSLGGAISTEAWKVCSRTNRKEYTFVQYI